MPKRSSGRVGRGHGSPARAGRQGERAHRGAAGSWAVLGEPGQALLGLGVERVAGDGQVVPGPGLGDPADRGAGVAEVADQGGVGVGSLSTAAFWISVPSRSCLRASSSRGARRPGRRSSWRAWPSPRIDSRRLGASSWAIRNWRTASAPSLRARASRPRSRARPRWSAGPAASRASAAAASPRSRAIRTRAARASASDSGSGARTPRPRRTGSARGGPRPARAGPSGRWVGLDALRQGRGDLGGLPGHPRVRHQRKTSG